MTVNTDQSVFESKEYLRSRRAYRLECAFEYFVALVVSGAFLATLLTSIGISDAVTGIISSFISLAFLFQIFSIFVVRKVSNTKRFVIIFHFLSQMFFMALYIVPFLPFTVEYKQVAVIICMLLAYFGNYFVTSMIYNWGNSHVDPRKRASYSAGKEMLSLISGMAITLLLGYVMDYFEMMDNTEGGFIFIAVSVFIFSVCDLICLLLIKNRIKPKEKAAGVPMKTVMKKTVGNRNFVNVIILTSLWEIGRYTTIGFMGTYQIKELAYTVGAVQVINIVANFARFAVSKPFGRYSDKTSFSRGAEIGLIIAAASFAVNMFTTPSNRVFVIIYTILFNVAAAGTSQNFFSIAYSYVDGDYFVEASAIKNSISGILGFAASIGASALLDYIQNNGNMLFGIHVYGQQVLSAISFAFVLAAILFNHFVIRKQKIIIQ